MSGAVSVHFSTVQDLSSQGVAEVTLAQVADNSVGCKSCYDPSKASTRLKFFLFSKISRSGSISKKDDLKG